MKKYVMFTTRMVLEMHMYVRLFSLFLTDFLGEISFALLSVTRLKTLLKQYDDAKILEPRLLGSFSKKVSVT